MGLTSWVELDAMVTAVASVHRRLALGGQRGTVPSDELRQAVLYWRRWDARTGVTHNVTKLELDLSDPSFT